MTAMPGNRLPCAMAYWSVRGSAGNEPIRAYADKRERGRVFGWYHLIPGLGGIPAGVCSVLAGLRR